MLSEVSIKTSCYLCPTEVGSYRCRFREGIRDNQGTNLAHAGSRRARKQKTCRKQKQQGNSEYQRNMSNCNLQGSNQSEAHMCLNLLLPLNSHLWGSPHLWGLPPAGLRNTNRNLKGQVMLDHRKPVLPIYVALCLYGIISTFWP